MIGTGRQREVAGWPSLIQRPHTECARDTLPSLHWTVDITCIVKFYTVYSSHTQSTPSIISFTNPLALGSGLVERTPKNNGNISSEANMSQPHSMPV